MERVGTCSVSSGTKFPDQQRRHMLGPACDSGPTNLASLFARPANNPLRSARLSAAAALNCPQPLLETRQRMGSDQWASSRGLCHSSAWPQTNLDVCRDRQRRRAQPQSFSRGEDLLRSTQRNRSFGPSATDDGCRGRLLLV